MGVKVVYVIGPLRADTPWGVEQNIREAERAAVQVWRAGLSANCVHSATRFMHGAAPEAVFLDGVTEQLRRADAVIVVGGWTCSEGSRLEVQEAQRLGLPVLYAWGDESYSHGILCALKRTPEGFRVMPSTQDLSQTGDYWLGGAFL